MLEPYRHTARKVLEIGILSGCSLRMWEEYFTSAEVHGVDLCEVPLNMFDLRPMIEEGTHHISLLDATFPDQVEAHFSGIEFDVIIEDASHAIDHQLAIYANFKNKLSKNGIYIIEDVADIDATHALFEKLDPNRNWQIIDRRNVKGRFDDVLVVIGGPREL